MTLRLRYVGASPTTFVELGAELSPGDEFLVSDERAPGFLVRSDVEEVPDEPPVRIAPKRRNRSEDPAPTDEPELADDQGTGTDSTSI